MKYLFALIHMSLIFFIADSMVATVYTYYTEKFVKSSPLIVAKQIDALSEKKTEKQLLNHYNNVVDRDLFKTKTIKLPPAKPLPKKESPQPGANAKITDLKLELKGTITGNGASPAAIIKTQKDKKGKLYLEGNAVDRAIIKTILRGKVVLLVGGKEELLVMKTPNSKGGSLPGTTAAPANGWAEDQIQLSWDQVNDMKAKIAELRKQVMVRPHYDKGKIDGFRITSVKKDSVFYDTLGLRNGDIISEVDGQEIRSMADAAKIYSMFSQSDGNASADVKVKRNGQERTIQYSIQ